MKDAFGTNNPIQITLAKGLHMKIEYRGVLQSCYILQAFDTTMDSVDEVMYGKEEHIYIKRSSYF